MTVPRIAKEDLKVRIDRGEEVVLVDVRAPDSYIGSNVKIKGAVRKDPMTVQSWHKEIPHDKLIVAYCT